MGRFTILMLVDFSGFQRILTILARGYLFRADKAQSLLWRHRFQPELGCGTEQGGD